MSTIRHALEAACPPPRLWALLADLEAVGRYNPAVRSVRLRGGRAAGIGAERECTLAPRGRVVERVTVWEDGRALGLEVAESDWPLRHMRWVTRIEPAAAGARLSQVLDYRLRFGPVGWLLDRLLVRRRIAAAVEASLRGLIALAEAEA
ncbi:MAG: SRPBCC family protein [Alphaproteobacteria bacterium]